MKLIAILVASAALAGCGAETASTAGAIATAKKQEIEQAERTVEQMQQNISEAMEAQQRAARAEAAGK